MLYEVITEPYDPGFGNEKTREAEGYCGQEHSALENRLSPEGVAEFSGDKDAGETGADGQRDV